MNLRELLKLGRLPAKAATGAIPPAPAGGKSPRNTPATPRTAAEKAREEAADRAISIALDADAKGEPPRKR